MLQQKSRVAGLTLPIMAACSASVPKTGETMSNDETIETAPGTNRDFSFTVSTIAPDQIWRLWTSPATWGSWDQGLKSASMKGEMRLGSTGQIQPLSGPRSSFEVVAFDPHNAYAFVTRLPMARLRVERFFNEDRTTFTHRVSFSGPMAFAFARMFGSGFRRVLPPTMRQLNTLAEGA